MKRIKAIKISRLLLLVFTLVFSVTVLYLGFSKVLDFTQQRYRLAYVNELISKREDFISSLNKLQNSGNISDSTYENLRTMAKEDNQQAYADLFNYQNGQRIEDEDFEKIKKLDVENDGYRYMEILKNSYQIPESYIEFLLKDSDRYDFVAAYLDQDKYQKAPKKLTESLDEVPPLLQWDLRWGYIPYGDSNISIAGCGPTSLSMVYSYLLQDPTITPVTLARYSEDHGFYVTDVGTDHRIFSESAADYGLKEEEVAPTEEAIKNALQEGQILIVSVTPGDFTTTGHFVVVTGMNEGKLIVNDPNSIKNSNKLWDIDTLLAQTYKVWAYSK